MDLTVQEKMWIGQFGNEYVERNGLEYMPGRYDFWSRVMGGYYAGFASCLELGSNIGLNLRAIRQIFPHVSLSAVEINKKAAMALQDALEDVKVYNQSILNFQTTERYDLTFTCGVMIHIHPDKLPIVYDCLYKHSKKYILLSEYYSLTPQEVSYRGHSELLFKRDFAGELMDCFPDLKLLDYGFNYHRGNHPDKEDYNWFLFRKPTV